MRLELYNFRCYQSKILELPDNGLLLLSAPSGTGKSTIFKAILFALFGIGKKLCLWGKKSCRVVLSIDISGKKVEITRTKCPNRLVLEYPGNLGDRYEDAVAQNIINDIFGQNFPETSFVDNQNIYKTFLMMSPTDKLSFLENFALRNTNIKDIKQKIKDEIRGKSTEQTEINININSKRDTLEHFPEQKLGEFPIKYKNREKAINNYRIKRKNAKILSKRCRLKIEELHKEYKSLNDKYHKNQLKSLRLVALKDERVKILKDLEAKGKNILKEKTISEYKELIKKKENIKIKNELLKEITELEIRIKNSKKDEQSELREKISRLKNSTTRNPKDISGELSILRQVKPKFVEYKKIEKELVDYEEVDEDDISRFEKQLNDITEKMEKLYSELRDAEISEKKLECPNCSQTVYLKDNILISVDREIPTSLDRQKINTSLKSCKKRQNDFQKTIEEYKNNILEKAKLKKEIVEIVEFLEEKGYNPKKESLNKIVEKIDTLSSELESLEKNIEKRVELENLLTSEKFSSSILLMEKDLAKKKKLLEPLENPILDSQEFPDSFDIEKIAKLLDSHYAFFDEVQDLENRLQKVDKEIDSIKIEEISTIDLETLQKTIDSKIEEESDHLKEEEKFEYTLKHIDIYLEKEKIQKNREKILDDISILEKEEETVLKRYNAALTLKEKVLEAESISINNVIQTINEYVAYYLSKFFDNETVNIQLIPYKLKKNSLKENVNKKEYIEKPQINVQLIYKDEECDISSLSGGELSRVVLAFTLALAKMFDTKLILLDEATANLDHENTQNVFSVIKEEFSDIFVIAVAHQVVEGSYDHVIYLE